MINPSLQESFVDLAPQIGVILAFTPLALLTVKSRLDVRTFGLLCALEIVVFAIFFHVGGVPAFLFALDGTDLLGGISVESHRHLEVSAVTVDFLGNVLMLAIVAGVVYLARRLAISAKRMKTRFG